MGTQAARRGAAALWLGPLLFAALDAGARTVLAGMLQLEHDPASRDAALRGVALGTAKDLACVLPAFLALALWPGRATRSLAQAALLGAAALLAGDLLYFHQTLEHVEPVLFANLNRHAARGALGGVSPSWLGAGAAAFAALAWLHGRVLRAVRGGPRAAWAPGLAVLLCGGLWASGLRAGLPPRETEIERFLDETRAAYLEKVSAPILAGFVAAALRGARAEAPAPRAPFRAYQPEERAVLDGLGLLPTAAAPLAAPGPELRRIVFLVFESLPAAYLHHYNPRVPPQATAFFDSLLASHPRADRFYTSNMPTDYGLNSLFLSRLEPDWGGGRPSLFSVLREERGFESWFVRGVSKHYGNQLATYPRLFRMDHFFAFEELRERYDVKWRSGWGMNNQVVYAEGLRILRESRDRKALLVLKTIDLHQPGPFPGIPRERLPEALRGASRMHAALYWADWCLRGFFAELEREELLDQHTLVVLTSDHSPHPGVAYRETVPPEEYERLGRLPLVFVSPGAARFEGLDPAGLASQIDLAPTLLALLGLPAPPDFQGRSLLGSGAPGFRIGIYDGELRYASEALDFREDLGRAEGPRAQALRKWLRNGPALSARREARGSAASRGRGEG